MNLFRLAGDLTHLASFVVLLLKILATRSCRGKRMNPGRPPSWKRQRSFSKKKKNNVIQLPNVDGHQSHIFFPFSPLSKTGISLRTQELYTLVFVCRYLDLFTR